MKRCDRGENVKTLSLKTKIFYGVGDYGFAMTDNMLALLFAVFLTDVVGLTPYLAAAAVFIGRTWDYINDPVFGYLSDRVRTRWGRRRPFLILGIVPYALSFTLLWWHPPISNEVGLAVYYAFAYALYDTCITMAMMPYYALTPELTDDYDERTNLTSFRMVFSIIGTFTAFVLPLALIGTMDPTNQSKITSVALLIGAMAALPLILTFLGTRERPELQEMERPSLKDSLLSVRGNRPFMITMGIFLFTFTGLEIIAALMIYFLKYRMGLEEQSDLIFAVLFLVALISLPFWNWISSRWDKRRAYILGMFYLAAVMVLTILVRPEWGMPAILAASMLVGVGFGCVQVLPWAIIPDAVEYDELTTGQRHEGVYYSLVTLFRKVSISIAVPLTLVVLGWTGYVANAETQPPSAMLGILVLVGIVPSLLFLTGALFARSLPITRQEFARVRAELERRRSTPEAVN
jgi:GPH family glycoside/pentoside/hexuronide:cation symporter